MNEDLSHILWSGRSRKNEPNNGGEMFHPRQDQYLSVSLKKCGSSVHRPSQASLELEIWGFGVFTPNQSLGYAIWSSAKNGTPIQPWRTVHKMQTSRPLLLQVLTCAS